MTLEALLRASVKFPAIRSLTGQKADEVILPADHTIGTAIGITSCAGLPEGILPRVVAQGVVPTVVSQLLDDEHNDLPAYPVMLELPENPACK